MRRGARSVVRPFPWGSLESMTRDDVASLRDLHALGDALGAGAMRRAFAAIVGADVAVLLRGVGGAARPVDPAVVVELASPGDPSPIRVEVEASLAGATVARALKRRAPNVIDPARPLPAPVAGAWAAIVAAAARRASPDQPLRVVSVDASARGAAHDPRASIAAALTVVLGDEAHLARIVVPRAIATAAPSAAWPGRAIAANVDRDGARGPAGLGALAASLPAALAVVACASLADAVDVATLSPGDVWIPGAPFPLARAADGSWRGSVLLAAAGSERAARAEIVDGDHLVLRGHVEDLAMTSEGDGNVVVENVGEVPVVVRVEVGAVEMRVREWAALRPGDVIPLGRRIADPVVLRAGTSEVARGELVEIDGEVGVRVLAPKEDA